MYKISLNMSSCKTHNLLDYFGAHLENDAPEGIVGKDNHWLCFIFVKVVGELWCRLQTQLRSSVAVAVAEAGGYSSDWTPRLGTST